MFEEVMEWFGSHLPDERKTGLRIVHGDYKIENLVFHPTENRIIGILDWELCTLGSPVRGIPALIDGVPNLSLLIARRPCVSHPALVYRPGVHPEGGPLGCAGRSEKHEGQAYRARRPRARILQADKNVISRSRHQLRKELDAHAGAYFCLGYSE